MSSRVERTHYQILSTVCFTDSFQCNPLLARWLLCIPPSGHYMYHQINIQQFYVLPTQCVYVFCVDLRINSDYFSTQH